MALRHRRPLVPERAVNVDRRARFTWLHRRPCCSRVLLALAALDAWLFGIHGIAGGMRAVLYNPMLLLGVLALDRRRHRVPRDRPRQRVPATAARGPG